MNELLLFHAGNRQFGMALPLVRSIQGAKTLCEEPASSEYEPSDAEKRVLRSSAYIRTSDAEGPVPIYDLSEILGDGSGSEPNENKKVMFVAVGNHLLALKVDRVERVISVEREQIEALSPVFEGPSLTWFPRVLKQDGNLILLLNPGGILGIEEEYPEDKADLSYIPDEEAISSIVSDEESLDVPEKSEQDLSYTAEEREPVPLENIRTEEFQPEESPSQEIPDAVIPSLSEAIEKDIPKPEFPTDSETLEKLLIHIVKQEVMSDMILRLLTPHLEKAVEKEIGMVKKIWRKNLKTG